MTIFKGVYHTPLHSPVAPFSLSTDLQLFLLDTFSEVELLHVYDLAPPRAFIECSAYTSYCESEFVYIEC